MKLKYTFELIEMDGEIFGVPIGSDADEFSGIIKLNDSAAEIFRLLNEKTTEEAIVNALIEKYDADREMILSSVCDYIGNLKNDGLLID